MLIRARTVYPVVSPQIDNGAVRIENGQILEVGTFQDLSRTGDTIDDLGEVTLMPGLINAHCHLDYTDMAGLITPPASFLDWITAIIAIKGEWDYSDYARSWVNGAAQLLNSGVTTVADTEAVPEMLPDIANATSIRLHSFIELLSVRKLKPVAALLREADEWIRKSASVSDRFTGGLSPHALYSTSEELLRAAASGAHRLSIHVAESDHEDAMFRHAEGPMFNWLQRNGRDMSDCGGLSPVGRLKQLELLSDRLMAIHCNHLDDQDIEDLGNSGTHVIHCPRSHDYFGHAPFQLNKLTAARVNVCIGTDSLASVRGGGKPKPSLNLFSEIRQALDTHPALTPETAIRMVTIQPATALGRQTDLGSIRQGAKADLIAVPGSTPEEIVATKKPLAVMIDGSWVHSTSR